uniref:type II CRISPR-associated endonuclease Cas1 n=1 Tax=uncultured Lactobacillus sp. TaxID=153152 RepID=UPI0025FE56EE
MGWRSVIITQHAKLTYSMQMMIVQTRDGINQIPIEDVNLLLVSTTQAVITSALISKLAQNQTKVIFVDEKDNPVVETAVYYPGARNMAKLKKQFNWDEHLKEELWTKIVSQKIKNQIAVLANYHLNKDEVQSELDQLEINDESNREAIAARKYFMLLFDKNFVRRDTSAINAALDYGYAILLSSFN